MRSRWSAMAGRAAGVELSPGGHSRPPFPGCSWETPAIAVHAGPRRASCLASGCFSAEGTGRRIYDCCTALGRYHQLLCRHFGRSRRPSRWSTAGCLEGRVSGLRDKPAAEGWRSVHGAGRPELGASCLLQASHGVATTSWSCAAGFDSRGHSGPPYTRAGQGGCRRMGDGAVERRHLFRIRYSRGDSRRLPRGRRAARRGRHCGVSSCTHPADGVRAGSDEGRHCWKRCRRLERPCRRRTGKSGEPWRAHRQHVLQGTSELLGQLRRTTPWPKRSWKSARWRLPLRQMGRCFACCRLRPSCWRSFLQSPPLRIPSRQLCLLEAAGTTCQAILTEPKALRQGRLF